MCVLLWPKTVLWLEKQAKASLCMRFQRFPRYLVWVSQAREVKPLGQAWLRPPTGTMDGPWLPDSASVLWGDERTLAQAFGWVPSIVQYCHWSLYSSALVTCCLT